MTLTNFPSIKSVLKCVEPPFYLVRDKRQPNSDSVYCHTTVLPNLWCLM